MKRLRKQTGKKRRKEEEGKVMERKVWKFTLIVISQVRFVTCFFFFSSLLFFFVLKGRGPCYFVSSLTMHAASIFGNNTRSERGRVRPREQKGPREETSQRER